MSFFTSGGLDLMEQTDPQRYLKFNRTSWAINVLQTGVIRRDLTAPPVSPAVGDAYIPATPATYEWTGLENKIVFWFEEVWVDLEPELAQGNGVYVFEEGVRIRWHPEASPPAYEIVGATAITGPGSSSDSAIALFDGIGGDTLKDSSVTISTDGTLASNSDSKIPTEKAVKAYADSISAANDAMVFKGNIDCSSNPNYPAADRGHTYRVSVAGKIGGGSGPNVEAGDLLVCLTDGTASGTHATVGSNWSIAQTNIDGAVVGPGSSTSGNLPSFSGTNGKTLQDSGVAAANVVSAAAVITDDRLTRGDGGARGVQETGITVSDNDEISGQKGLITDHSGTTYTFQASDTGGIHTFSNAAGCTVTLPNSLSKGWNVTWSQKAAVQVTFSPASGATMRNRQSHTKSAGLYGVGILFVDSNSGGSSADYYLGGDTGA